MLQWHNMQFTELKYGFKCKGFGLFVHVKVGFYSKHGVLEHARLSAVQSYRLLVGMSR